MNVNTFGGEIHNDGRQHIYRVKRAGPQDPTWSAIIGDCVHNLRAALDHLAWQLVLASGNRPDLTTQFPIRTSRCRWNPRTRCPEPTPLKVGGGVSREIMEVIESIQPYHGGDTGRRLKMLNSLDVVDKHHTLVVVAQVARAAGTNWDPGGVAPPDAIEVWWSRRRLVDDEIVVRFTFDPPNPELDPNLHFYPNVAFEKGGPCDDEPVIPVLEELITCVDTEVRPIVAGFF